MRSIGPAVALLVASAVVSPVHAQRLDAGARPDSVADQVALVAAPVVSPPAVAPARAPASRELGTGSYLALLAVGVGANGVWPVSRDPGTTKDRWDGQDKGVHAVINFALTQSAMDAGVRPSVAWVGACSAGAAFEITQGYISYKDMVANCVGAGAAVLWRRFWSGR